MVGILIGFAALAIALLSWRASSWNLVDGLHVTNGYVLLRDGSVRFVNTDGLLRLGGLPANKSNLVAIP